MHYLRRVWALGVEHPKRAVVVTACAAAAATLAASGTAFGVGASGDAKAIAYYRVAVSSTNDLSAYQITQTGFVRINDSVGKVNTSRWAWGNSQFQPGYYASKERIDLVQHAGKVAWLEDTLVPIVPKCHATVCAVVYPLQFYITKSTAYEGIITKGQNASCFYREPFANLPYRAGYGYWATYGYFYPMAIHGGLALITSKFPSGKQEETETDSINRSTKIFTSSSFHLAAGGGHRAYGYKAAYTVLHKTPKQPTVRLCSRNAVHVSVLMLPR